MFIEGDQVQSVKGYILELMDKMDEDDPEVLADYVIALLRNADDVESCKAVCEEQLAEFLQDETKGFVEKVFKYIGEKAAEAEAAEEAGAEAAEEEEGQEKEDSPPVYSRKEDGREEEDEDRNFKHTRKALEKRSREWDADEDWSEKGSHEKKRRVENSAKNGANVKRSSNRRPCYSYDVKGYCLQGEMCTGSHGEDCIVVEGAKAQQHVYEVVYKYGKYGRGTSNLKKNVVYVHNIPEKHCSIEQINSCLKKFGTITNVGLKPNNIAVVQFSTPEEAQAACKSRDLFFNNPSVVVSLDQTSPVVAASVPAAPANTMPSLEKAKLISKIQKDLVKKYVQEQDTILKMLKTPNIPDKEKRALMEHFEKLSALTKSTLSKSLESSAASPPHNISGLNAIKDSRMFVESKIEKLKSLIPTSPSNRLIPKSPHNDKLWSSGLSLKIELPTPTPPDSLINQFKSFGPVIHVSVTNNGLSHIIKFQNPEHAFQAAKSPQKESVTITVIGKPATAQPAPAGLPKYNPQYSAEESSVDYDLES